MIKKHIVYLLVLILEFLFVLSPGQATAQTLTGSPLTAINKITAGTGSYSNGNVSATYNELIKRVSGRVLSVPTTATAVVSAGRLAGLAAGAMKFGTVVGIASVVIPIILQETGISVCPAPDFFCKSSKIEVKPTAGGYKAFTVSYSSALSACQAWFATRSPAQGFGNFRGVTESSGHFYCDTDASRQSYEVLFSAPTCGNGGTVSGYGCFSPGPLVGITESEISTPLQTKLSSNSTSSKNLYDELVKQKVPVLLSEDPVQVVAPSLSYPSETKNEQISNSDGTTSTKITTVTPTVNPVKTGTTINNTNLSYPITTVTNTTTTNNTTGAVTNTTITQTETADPSIPSDLQIPTDYNRELTQQKILDELSAPGTVLPADQEARTKIVVDKNSLDLDNKFKSIPTELTPDKALWFSWVWVPPTGSCSPNTGSVHGYTVTFDFCSWFQKIREAIGWFWAMIGAMYIYNLMFRSENG